MRQKLGAICAIASRPKFLVLDEPTVGVDPLSRRELWGVVGRYISKQECVCIFSTTYLEKAANADVTLVLRDGKLVVCDNPKNHRTSAKSNI